MAGDIIASSNTFGLALFSVTLYVTETPEPDGSALMVVILTPVDNKFSSASWRTSMTPVKKAVWNSLEAAWETLTSATSWVAVNITTFNVLATVGAEVGEMSTKVGALSTKASRYPALLRATDNDDTAVGEVKLLATVA